VKINFIKMHGLGNDFVIIDNRVNNISVNKELINKLSDRKSGVGCDQLIIIDSNSKADIHANIEIFNPSGDRAEACGNGTRCVAKLLFDESNKNEIQILSDAGILHAKRIDSSNISVNLGKLSTNWEKIPLSKEIDTLNININIDGFRNGVAVNIGNPHIVFFKENIDEVDLHTIGPIIENHKFFPNKTNVEIVEIINRNKIKMKVWERGAGSTLSCGSGACASVYAGQLKNLLNNNVEVQLELGSLFINILNNEAIMTGPAEISFFGNIEF
jgi:diaminopimelate epimerase